jgi:hypothetical protein
MQLEKTLKNLRATKNSLFNLEEKSPLNWDLIKKKLKFLRNNHTTEFIDYFNTTLPLKGGYFYYRNGRKSMYLNHFPKPFYKLLK